MSKRADRLAKNQEKSKLSCKGVDCNNDQHSYSPAPRRAADRRRLLESVGLSSSPAVVAPYANDKCWACGDESIDWAITRQRDPARLNEIIAYLEKEYIRYLYWLRPIDELALEAAVKAGYEETRGQVQQRIATSIMRPRQSRFDDIITPWEGKSVIHYAQHATATCCRKCFAQWYGVPADQGNLSEEQARFAELLILEYLARRHDDIWGRPA